MFVLHIQLPVPPHPSQMDELCDFPQEEVDPEPSRVIVIDIIGNDGEDDE